MNTLAITLALLLALVGCTCFYLASPNQRWRATPLPAAATRLSGGILATASLYAFTRALDPFPATYTFVSWVMLLLVSLPYLGAALAKRRGGP